MDEWQIYMNNVRDSAQYMGILSMLNTQQEDVIEKLEKSTEALLKCSFFPPEVKAELTKAFEDVRATLAAHKKISITASKVFSQSSKEFNELYKNLKEEFE